jgi:hypothetical protein
LKRVENNVVFFVREPYLSQYRSKKIKLESKFDIKNYLFSIGGFYMIFLHYSIPVHNFGFNKKDMTKLLLYFIIQGPHSSFTEKTEPYKLYDLIAFL